MAEKRWFYAYGIRDRITSRGNIVKGLQLLNWKRFLPLRQAMKRLRIDNPNKEYRTMKYSESSGLGGRAHFIEEAFKKR